MKNPLQKYQKLGLRDSLPKIYQYPIKKFWLPSSVLKFGEKKIK